MPGRRDGGADARARRGCAAASRPITPTSPATIIEWLVEDGDPVSPGQPLVRLEPAVHAAAEEGH